MPPEDNPADDVEPTREEYDRRFLEAAAEVTSTRSDPPIEDAWGIPTVRVPTLAWLSAVAVACAYRGKHEPGPPVDHARLAANGFQAGKWVSVAQQSGRREWLPDPTSNVYRREVADDGCCRRWLYAHFEEHLPAPVLSLDLRAGGDEVTLLVNPTAADLAALIELLTRKASP